MRSVGQRRGRPAAERRQGEGSRRGGASESRRRGGDAGSRDDALGRDTADVQTVSAHEVAFNQGDFGAESGSTRSRHQACCACTNDDEVVAPRWCWILPVYWMNVGFKLLVKFVQWFQLWKHQQNQSLEVKRATSRLARIGNVPSRTKARTTCLLRIG